MTVALLIQHAGIVALLVAAAALVIIADTIWRGYGVGEHPDHVVEPSRRDKARGRR